MFDSPNPVLRCKVTVDPKPRTIHTTVYDVTHHKTLIDITHEWPDVVHPVYARTLDKCAFDIVATSNATTTPENPVAVSVDWITLAPLRRAERMGFEDKHRDVLRAYADKFGIPNISDDHSRGWARRLAEQFAFSFPSEGWGSKSAHQAGVPTTTDAVARHVNGRLVSYDVVTGGGAPGASINYHPHEDDINNQKFLPVTPTNHIGGPPAQRKILLGISWFCMQTALRDWGERARGDGQVIKNALAPNVYRTMAHVTGGPWQAAAVNINDPRWRDDWNRKHDWLEANGALDFVTFFGGHEGVPTLDDKKRAIDKIAQGIRERRNTCWKGELVNEWKNIGWQRSDVGDGATRGATATRLRSCAVKPLPLTSCVGW